MRRWLAVLMLCGSPASAECDVLRWVDMAAPGDVASWLVAVDGGMAVPVYLPVAPTPPTPYWQGRIPPGSIDWSRLNGDHTVVVVAVHSDGRQSVASNQKDYSWAGCADANGDGVVGALDWGVFRSWWGATVP
jgi:hypothetical protein